MSASWLDQMCEQIATETGYNATPKSVRRVIDSFYKVILRQLQINGKVTIPNFGTFEIETRNCRERKVGDPHNGGVKYIYVKPRNKIVFRMSHALDRNINENQFEMRNKKKNTKKESYHKIKPMEYTLAQMFQNAQQRGKNSKNGKTDL